MRRALLVGINDYSWAPLKGCINDVVKMEAALAEHHDGQPNFEITKITSDQQPVTEALLYKGVSELFSNAADVALFFFSGHGVERPLGGYLVTQDGEKHDIGMSINEVIQLANLADHIKEVVIIIDACHSGHAGNINPLNKNIASLRKGVTILASCLPDEYAMEKNGQGVFTSLVTEAINGGAADVLGHVTIAGVYNHADKALGAMDQRPVFKTYVTQLFSLKNHKPQIAWRALENLTTYFPQNDSQYKLCPTYEPTADPKDEEKEAIFDFLQKCVRKNLVEPVGEEHMYYAAMNRKSCQLTQTGRLYWKMVKQGKI